MDELKFRIDVSFWQGVYEKKLKIWRLDYGNVTIHALVEKDFLQLTERSFESHGLRGKIVCLNKLDEFENFEVLKNCEDEFRDSGLLTSSMNFLLFCFVDLKSFKIKYSIAFPTKVYENFGFKEIKSSEYDVEFEDLTPRPNPVSVTYMTSLTENGKKTFLRKYGKASFPYKLAKAEIIKTYSLLRTRRGTCHELDISSYLSPESVAEEAIQLNVELIRWRILPQFDPKKLDRSCLILGAGTLGCHVARLLLAYGVKKISFVDSGTVRFSTPGRQGLYEFCDAVEGTYKVSSAAKNLKKILPTIDTSQSTYLKIPMPGHCNNNEDEILRDFKTLDSLITQHEVIFFLTDSKESRWLPLLLSLEKKKLGFCSAIGFDSYVCQLTTGNSEACYFCNSDSAPSDSISFRTIDQQCTVSRPGVASAAAGALVELFASESQSTITSLDEVSCLGTRPSQIRGFLSNFSTSVSVEPKNEFCTCCSERVIQEFRQGGQKFILEVMKNPSLLELVSGLEKWKLNCRDEEVINF